ncbi:MAG: DNA repair protein RecO [Clostridia bacterium]|nr:DNA repair protein RecO [Clostridia bacterium]
MKTTTVKGLIIKETKVGEGNKIFTILTEEMGKIQVSAAGVRSFKSKISGACSLFCYSKFIISKGKSMYNVSSADCIYNFFTLRNDFEKLSYATYFCDLTGSVMVEQQDNSVLKLLLNTLYYLEKHDNYSVIKPVFELRLMTMCGFAPLISSCNNCGEKDDITYFSADDGVVYCSKCSPRTNMNHDTYNAIFYILYCDDNKIFSFNASGEVLSQLNILSENYVAAQTGNRLKSLDYLKNNFQII